MLFKLLVGAVHLTSDKINTKKLYPENTLIFSPKVESRTQGSRPRPRAQKKSEAKDSPSEDRPSRKSSRPRIKETRRKCSPKKKRRQNFFSGDLQKRGLKNFFSGHLQNFNNSEYSAVLEPRTGQFSRT